MARESILFRIVPFLRPGPRPPPPPPQKNSFCPYRANMGPPVTHHGGGFVDFFFKKNPSPAAKGKVKRVASRQNINIYPLRHTAQWFDKKKPPRTRIHCLLSQKDFLVTQLKGKHVWCTVDVSPKISKIWKKHSPLPPSPPFPPSLPHEIIFKRENNKNRAISQTRIF